jgi:hypothetical protein
LTPGVWYHVAVVLDAIKGQGKIFINGVLDHVMLGVGQAATNTAPLRIGTFTTTSATYHGKIDDVRLWTRPLSESEVAALVPGATVNALPVADAGPPRSATCPARVGLQGTFSDDRHPSTSSIATAWWWKKVSGPADIHFDNAFSLTPIVELTHPGTYVFELTGSDGAHRVRDTVVVTCN